MFEHRCDDARSARSGRIARFAAVVSCALAISLVPALAAAWTAVAGTENVPGGGSFVKRPALVG